MFAMLRPAVLLLGLFSLLTGLLYPAAVTGIAQTLFPEQANGSLIREGGRVLGSELIGQPFTSPRYFWSRPSATLEHPYNGGSSGASNWGPTNPKLQAAVEDRVAALRAADPDNREPIPADLVTASGSGLDPHISPAAAYYQANRVARVRNIPVEQVRRLITEYTEGRSLGVLGEPRVNVLKLNRALDALVG